MSYEYPRFKEWADKNYPAEDYFSAEDRLSDIETRMNGDGRPMPEQLRQSLLGEFQAFYDPAIREANRRREEQRQIAEFLGNGEIPTSWSDEYIAELNRPEIMDIDFSQFQTSVETVYPPEITKFQRPSGFKAITLGIKGFFRKLFGR